VFTEGTPERDVPLAVLTYSYILSQAGATPGQLYFALFLFFVTFLVFFYIITYLEKALARAFKPSTVNVSK
jgi:hypothetical protein